MTVLQVGILAVLAAAIGQLGRGRELALLAVSALAIFWLQPAEPAAQLRFWIPLATLAVVVLSWAVTAAPEVRSFRQNWPAAAVLVAVVILGDLNRYAGLEQLAATITPSPVKVAVALAAIGILAVVGSRWLRGRALTTVLMLIGILAAFVLLKTPWLAARAGAHAAALFGGKAAGDTAPLTWLGYSYVAFRLIHTIRDRQMGRLGPVTLSEYVDYAIFFPAFTAGPIDRVEHFTKELCTPPHLGNDDWLEAGSRLFVGLFKKFVIADLLAVISINDALVTQVKSGPWLWVFLYAYAFRLYLDFSGYTDVAIGLARLMGIRLPENFASPYLKPNITQFWNAWHMTLTQWFRAYFFNPLVRWMRGGKWPVWITILVAQLATMVLIGLWHGIAAGFVVWGLWHGLGLFLHNRWTDFIKARTPAWMGSGRGLALANALGVFLTFNYVAVGWLFFSLSSPRVAWLALQRMFGLA